MSDDKKQPAPPLTLEHALSLHGLTKLPPGPPWLAELFLTSTRELVERHGEAWVREHRELLVQALEYLATM